MEPDSPEKAVLLLSGGMDSTTLLWWMHRNGTREIHTVGIDYGQRHRIELEAGTSLSNLGSARSHKILSLDLTQIGGSPLTSADLDVPDADDLRQIDTVVPYRNMLFMTAAAAHAESLGISDIFISPVQDDYTAYRDCRREFYDALEIALSLGATRETQVTIHTPFIAMSKSEVIAVGLKLGVPYEHTYTCYNGTQPSCGRCDACTERLQAFAANNTEDPIAYAEGPAG